MLCSNIIIYDYLKIIKSMRLRVTRACNLLIYDVHKVKLGST
jgi:hypothetical protein